MLTHRSAAESICVCEKLTWFCHWRAEFPFQNLLVYSLSKFTKCFRTRMLLFIQVNGEFPYHQVGNLNEGRTIHQILAQELWPNTFRLDRTTLGKPVGRVTRQNSCEACLGRPMEQPEPGEKESAPCLPLLANVLRSD